MEIYNLIEKIAPTDLPVLIQGKTGTGKELVARVLHYRSLRKDKLWLVLNCSAVPETLLENELFGHTKGAFTDAHNDKKGYIELASEGTLFLDEIGNMSSNMQQKLLRVLEEKQVWRLGAEKPVPINTRFIFASNRNIEELVKVKKFREDLYYRMNTIVITLPPLRDRKDDIPLLINHFLAKYSRPSSLVLSLSSEALKLLVDYPWPGNVRELENEIKRICALYPNAITITKSMISENIINRISPLSITGNQSMKELTDSLHRNLIQDALKKSNGNISETARLLGCDRAGLYKKIKQLKIDISDAYKPANVTKK
jgi:transcriptional regulator with PAS, ATPase and Fis domain